MITTIFSRVRPVFALATAVVLLSWISSAHACCGQGCCDCSCVAFKLNKRAPAIAASIQKSLGASSGSIQSFSVDFSDAKLKGRWSCAPSLNAAVCTRQ
jgi:hypothetical protein